jgi:hypothetical protein
LTIIVNHLELFSIIFGASLVFQISSNFAFKNILEKWDFDLKMDFESLIQNLFGISKCALKQCCRELNFEQLLFWCQLVKMSFSTSKYEFGTVTKI